MDKDRESVDLASIEMMTNAQLRARILEVHKDHNDKMPVYLAMMEEADRRFKGGRWK